MKEQKECQVLNIKDFDDIKKNQKTRSCFRLDEAAEYLAQTTQADSVFVVIKKEGVLHFSAYHFLMYEKLLTIQQLNDLLLGQVEKFKEDIE